MQEPPFYQTRLKLKRADHLVRKIDTIITDYIASEPITITEWIEDEYLRFEYTVHSEPTDLLGPMIGDTIHNLRSALDIMACVLVRLNKKPTKNVYFPFANSSLELDDQIKRRNFNRASDEIVGLLKEINPTKDGNPTLRAIHDLDIQDKHTGLIPANAYVSRAGVGIGKAFIGQAPRKSGGGSTLINEKTNPRNGTFAMPIVIKFHPASPFSNHEVCETLHSLTKHTRGIIDAFEFRALGTITE